jgi:hypothetical protein
MNVPIIKNEIMPIVITKSIFHTKNVTEKEGGMSENSHVIQYFA